MKINRILLCITCVVAFASAAALPAAAIGMSPSVGTVTFGEKAVTPPVDPENPANPQEPPEVPGTGQMGDLTLDVVPHPEFGERPVATVNTVYDSKIVAGTGNGTGAAGAQTFLQVSDTRTAENANWSVKVKADLFEGGGSQISGARIRFFAGEVNGSTGQNGPVSHTVEINCVDTVELGQNEEIIFDSTDSGPGTWINCLYPTPWTNPAIGSDNAMVQLFVPANSGALADVTYKSDLTWTLSDAP